MNIGIRTHHPCATGLWQILATMRSCSSILHAHHFKRSVKLKCRESGVMFLTVGPVMNKTICSAHRLSPKVHFFFSVPDFCKQFNPKKNILCHSLRWYFIRHRINVDDWCLNTVASAFASATELTRTTCSTLKAIVNTIVYTPCCGCWFN